MEKLWHPPTLRERLWLNRGDLGFGQEAILAWHEAAGEQRPKYLFKLKLTTNVRRAIARVPWPLWEGAPTLGEHVWFRVSDSRAYLTSCAISWRTAVEGAHTHLRPA
jgi:hypothetical protein